jgi:CheY-like chemotaxis protein
MVKTAPRVILVVDDDPIVREALIRSLDGPRYTLVPADSALQALDLMRSVHVDAVIADLNMPGMNGVRFLVYVRDMFPDCVRLILSGARHSDIEDLAMAGVGRQHFLRKGIKPEELQLTVDVALGRQ